MSIVHEHLRRMSYSSRCTLHECPKKLQLYKMGAQQNVDDMWTELDGEEAVPAVSIEGNVHFDFGSLVGDATQYYMAYGDLQETIFRMFVQWGRPLDDEGPRGRKGKTFFHAIHAVQQFAEFRDRELAQWEVAQFNNAPACELGFSIDCGDGFKERGFLDMALRNKLTGGFAVFEGKTTGAKWINEAMYGNSGQGLGYDLVLETVAGSEQFKYPVLYVVYTTGSMEWTLLQFPKNKLSRANWIRALLRDKQHIAEFAEDGFFPMHGESCFKYGRQCEYYGTCELLKVDENAPVLPERGLEKFTLHFSLEEIVRKQLESLT